MRFGPTSLQLSSLLAKGLRRPKLRSDLRVSEQVVAGKTTYVIKIPESSSYARYGEYEYELFQLCDGAHTPAEIATEMAERHPEKLLDEKEVLEFLDGMEPAMWERSVGEKNLAILEKIRDERKGRVDQTSLLYITFKAWDPDKTLGKMDRYLGWIFTRGFVIFSITMFGLAAAIWTTDWTRISQDTLAFYNFSNKSAYDLWMFWILLLVLGGTHELGHGLTCKHFGGEVHQMGFMLIYLTPAFYTDTTDIYLFARASPRQWTIFAGIWIELVICGISTVVWYFSLPGTFIADLSYKVLLFSGITGAVMNLNPLIKADGYYALSQYLQMESLREESFAYALAWLRRYVLRQDVELPPATKRKQRIYLIFASGAVVYSTGLLVFGVLWIKNIFVSHFEEWGYPMAAGVIYFFTRTKIQKALPVVRVRLREWKERFMAWKMTRVQQVGLAAVLLLLIVPLAAVKVSSDFVLEPGQRAVVRATVPGVVSEVRVRQGMQVHTGDVLAVLHNPELESQATITEQELRLVEAELRSAQDRQDPEEVAKAGRQRQELETELTVARTKLAQLTLRAPFDGLVTTPEVEQQLGDYMNEGDDFATVANRNEMKARILVQDLDLGDVSLGAPMKLQVRAYPFRTFRGTVQQILPAAALDRPVAQPQKFERYGQEISNYFAVVLQFPNPDGVLREGMTGTAKISGKRRYPLAWRTGRSAWRWLRSQVW